MLLIPNDIRVEADQEEEKALLNMSRTWLEQEVRTPGIHVSDLLDAKRAWYKKKDTKRTMTDREVTTFMIGKILHSHVISAASGGKGVDISTDEGSRTSKALGIEYSIDYQGKDKIPVEIKTSRSFYPPKGLKDLSMYCEQLLCYQAAENSLTGKIWILYLNLKDAQNRTCPEYRAYTVTVTQKALDEFKVQIKKVHAKLTKALKQKTPVGLDNCREWLCNERLCEYWHKCKPEGRYGLTKSNWTN